ncbi:MAG TPA: hypothetical protein DD444_11160 [Citreicella sp.]|jgi:putative tricarboxylic transport membrane protein|nr:hypothetical protein [Citreicella sp.]
MMKFNDRVIGILAILGGIAIISGTFGFREAPGQQFGSGFFPRIVGAAAMLAGLVQVLAARDRGPWIRIAPELRSRDAFLKLGVLAAVVFWLLTVQMLGFLLTTTLVALVLSVAMGARPLPATGVAAGLAALLWLVFGMVLRVPLPRGLIEGLMSWT